MKVLVYITLFVIKLQFRGSVFLIIKKLWMKEELAGESWKMIDKEIDNT